MDGKEAIALSSGPSLYYLHRGGISGLGHGSLDGSLRPHGLRYISNSELQAHSNTRPETVSEAAFSVDPSSHADFGHNINSVPLRTPPVKKKRGRPRKYGPDGQVSLGLLPLAARPNPSPSSDSMTFRRGRGRPPGSGRKQQLSLLGEWMSSSAGLAFAPHVITIAAGEDIVTKLLSFSQQRPRAICILSGTGTVSSVTLRQPASPDPSLTYEGRFQILCLSGSYLVSEDGGPRSRTGSISTSLSTPDGHVIGGAVSVLIAASPIQVVLCSFVYGGVSNKAKVQHLVSPKPEEESTHGSVEKPLSQNLAVMTSTPMQNYNPARVMYQRNPHADIDLSRG